MRVKLNLITLTDVKEFVDIMSKRKSKAVLVDKDHDFVVNATSMLGAMYSIEWDEIWLETEDDCCYNDIRKFMAE